MPWRAAAADLAAFARGEAPPPLQHLPLARALRAGAAGSTSAAGSEALQCLLALALGDAPGALRAALAYLLLKPEDALGRALVAGAAAAAVSAGALRALAAAGLPAGAHLLLHPLACPCCFQPLQEPTACVSLGLLTCAACRASAGRDAAAPPLQAEGGGGGGGGGGQQRSAAAASLLEACLQASWAPSVRARLQGNEALAAGDRAAAAGHFASAAAGSAAHFAAHGNLSLALLGQGRGLEALAAADAALAASPPFYAKAQWRRAKALEAQGWHKSALQAMLGVVARASLAGAASVHRLAWALTLKGDVAEVAAEDAERARARQAAAAAASAAAAAAPPAPGGPAAALPLDDAQAQELLHWCRTQGPALALGLALARSGAEALPPAALHLVALPRFASFSLAHAIGRSVLGELEALVGGCMVAEASLALAGAEGEAASESDAQEARVGAALAGLARFIQEAVASVNGDMQAAIAALAPSALAEQQALGALGWGLQQPSSSLELEGQPEPPGTAEASAALEGGVGATATPPAQPAPSAAAPAESAQWLAQDATPGSAFQPASASAVREALTCCCCFELQYEPVALPACGHTLCRPCMQRVLDHKPQCPVCRAPAQAMLTTRSYNTAVVQGLLRVCAGVGAGDMRARRAAALAERRASAHVLPIFVCSLVLPHAPCPLHIFEPRYRLMVRRCIADGSRCFGCVPHVAGAPGGFPDVGVALRVRSVSLLPDGRSYVDCVGEGGSRRFRVLQRQVSEGGYNLCTVQWLRDEDEGAELEHSGLAVEGEGGAAGGARVDAATAARRAAALAYLQRYLRAVFAAAQCRSAEEAQAFAAAQAEEEGGGGAGGSSVPLLRLGCAVLLNILSSGAQPPPLTRATAGPWLWWLASTLPVSDGEKYAWLGLTSWGERLECIAAALQGSSIATPLGLLGTVGRAVQGGQHCGVQ